MRRRRANPTCANPLCGCAIERWQRICGGCWKRLPFEQRQALTEACRGGRIAAYSALGHAAGAWLRGHDPAAEVERRLGERP
jgi:hypothetical protein